MLSLAKIALIPESLLLLILHATSALAQTQTLQLNQSLPLSSKSADTTFAIPSSSSPLAISIALCSAFPATGGPRFFVTNNSAVSTPGAGGGVDVFEILTGQSGIGSMVLSGLDGGGKFAFEAGSETMSFQVGLSDNGSLHSQLTTYALLGDTTSNQALLFSPPFLPPTIEEPTYPNYTLPAAATAFPDPPPSSQTPNFSLVVAPTSSFPLFDFNLNAYETGFPVTTCALETAKGVVSNATVNSSLVLPDANGWRWQWLVEGLTPSTNYTAYVVESGMKVGGPINFVTKSASFSCPLVHSLPYCPLVSYAVPLPGPPQPATSYDASLISTSVTDPLIQYMANFTTSLLTFACGRDWYSPVQSCASCQIAYNTWLCAVSFPRCGEADSSSTSSSSRNRKRDDSASQVPLAALLTQTNATIPRNANLPAFPGGTWAELLPCLETCNAADRACPDFIGFRCPVPRFNAASSYGVGYIDGDTQKAAGGQWEQGTGTTGMAQDRWGNVWCNGPGLT